MNWTIALCIGGIALGYISTWFLLVKSTHIINTIDKEKLHDAREIAQRLKL